MIVFTTNSIPQVGLYNKYTTRIPQVHIQLVYNQYTTGMDNISHVIDSSGNMQCGFWGSKSSFFNIANILHEL